MSRPTPDFSIVVPTRRRPSQLRRLLHALTQAQYPGEFEVVVATDGRDEETQGIVDAFARRLRVSLVVELRRGPAAARNAGASRAVGRYLAFTDDDCEPDPAWLSELAGQLAANPNSVVGGRVVNAVGRNVFSEASQLVIDAVYAHYRRRNAGMFFTSNNLAIRAETFHDVGGFDASFPYAGGEDRDFGDRSSGRGLELRYAPRAIVRHHHEATMRSFVRQHFTYGRGASHFHRARIGRGGGRVVVTPRFYLTLMRLAFSRNGGRHLQLAVLSLLSQLAYGAGFLIEEATGLAGAGRR